MALNIERTTELGLKRRGFLPRIQLGWQFKFHFNTKD